MERSGFNTRQMERAPITAEIHRHSLTNHLVMLGRRQVITGHDMVRTVPGFVVRNNYLHASLLPCLPNTYSSGKHRSKLNSSSKIKHLGVIPSDIVIISHPDITRCELRLCYVASDMSYIDLSDCNWTLKSC